MFVKCSVCWQTYESPQTQFLLKRASTSYINTRNIQNSLFASLSGIPCAHRWRIRVLRVKSRSTERRPSSGRVINHKFVPRLRGTTCSLNKKRLEQKTNTECLSIVRLHLVIFSVVFRYFGLASVT